MHWCRLRKVFKGCKKEQAHDYSEPVSANIFFLRLSYTATVSVGIVFKLADVMREKGYSKNKLCVNCGLRFETVQGYYNSNISRVDLYVLASICKELN